MNRRFWVGVVAALTATTVIVGPASAQAPEPVEPETSGLLGTQVESIDEDIVAVQGVAEVAVDEIADVLDDQLPEDSLAVSDQALVSADGVTVEEMGSEGFIPVDPTDGLEFTFQGVESAISLPVEQLELGTGVPLADGTMVYPGTDAGLAVRPVEGGGLQALVTIASAEAPTSYAYDLQLPDGANYNFLEDGGIIVTNSDDEVIGSFSPPWAVDANGASVPTHFELTSTGIVQIIEHNTGQFAYPVLADPCWTCLFDGVAVGIGLVVGIAGVAALCNVVCAVAGLTVAVYSGGRWVQQNYKSCSGKKWVNPWRQAYWGCRR